MDAGLILNMLSGNIAENTPGKGGVSYAVNNSGITNENSNQRAFPDLVSAIHAQFQTTQTTQSAPQASVNGILPTPSTYSVGTGVTSPTTAENILQQSGLVIDPETMQNILSSNKALANKLDSLIETGDIEGFASIMQNIKAIVEQINTGQFDIANLDAITSQFASTNTNQNGGTPAQNNHSLRNIQAAARFEPIVNVQTNMAGTNTAQGLPVDVLTELANLGQSPLSGATVTTQGQSGATPAATAMANNAADVTIPNVASATVNAASASSNSNGANPLVANTTAANATVATSPAVTGTASATPDNMSSIASGVHNTSSAQSTSQPAIEGAAIADANKTAHNPVVNGTIEEHANGTVNKDITGLTVAGLATTKTSGAQTPTGNTVVEGSALPHQAAQVATQKSQAQPNANAQTKGASAAGQVNIDANGHANNQSSGQNTGNNNANSQSNGDGQNQSDMGQSTANNSKPNMGGNNPQTLTGSETSTLAQNESKATTHSAAFAPFAAQAKASTETPARTTKSFGSEILGDHAVSSSEVKSAQATLVPKTFGGSISSGLTKNVANQVGMEVSRAVKEGNTEITVKLNPVELGKVTIKMAFDKDGRTSLRILAQSPETLALLQKDQAGLERALESGGVKSGQSNISLELDNQHDGRSAGKAFAEAAQAELAQENRNKAAALNADTVENTLPTEEVSSLEQILAQLDSASGLDIRV